MSRVLSSISSPGIRGRTFSKRSRGSARGYSLLEIVMTLAVMSIAVSAGMPEFRRMSSRNKLQGAVAGMTQVLHHARMAAIRAGVPVVVQADFEEDCLFDFADVDDRDGVPGSDLSFDPDPSKSPRNTDHEIARFTLEDVADPAARVYFWGVEDPAAEGPNAVSGFSSAPGPSADGKKNTPGRVAATGTSSGTP